MIVDSITILVTVPIVIFRPITSPIKVKPNHSKWDLEPFSFKWIFIIFWGPLNVSLHTSKSIDVFDKKSV